MTLALAPLFVRPEPALEEVPRRRMDPDADLRPTAETSANVAPVRAAFPSVTVRGIHAEITRVGDIFTAYVRVGADVHVFGVPGATYADHRDAAAEALALSRRNESADWTTAQMHALTTNPGFGGVRS